MLIILPMARVQPYYGQSQILDEKTRQKLIGFTLVAAILFAGLIIYQECHNMKVTKVIMQLANDIQILDKTFKEFHKRVKATEERMGTDGFEKITSYVNDLMDKHMMLKSSASGDKLIDYALDAAGATVIRTINTESYVDAKRKCTFLGFPVCSGHYDAETILQESNKPGDCWAVKGQEATVIIKLATSTFVQSVSLDHIHEKHAPLGETTSAPKKFSIWGVESEKSDHKHLFGMFHYNNKGPAVQTFPVQYPGLRPYRIVEFQLFSNHGHPKYTCIYKIRIHGRDASSMN